MKISNPFGKRAVAVAVVLLALAGTAAVLARRPDGP